jgi:hypothetical protein
MGKKKGRNKPRPVFERFKDGKVVGTTPVLSRNKNEDKESFLSRMKKLGYEELDKLGNHFTDNEMALHIGNAESCRYCRKIKGPSSPTSDGTEEIDKIPKDTRPTEPQMVADEQEAVAEKEESAKQTPKEGSVEDEKPQTKDERQKILDEIDDIEEKSEHVIDNATATKTVLSKKGMSQCPKCGQFFKRLKSHKCKSKK